MDEKIDEAINIALKWVRPNLKPDEALEVTQAVLNLMHAKNQWNSTQQPAPKANAK